MTRNMARILVSYELLEDLLLLPRDAKVIAVGQDFTDTVKRVFHIIVEHPDLPEVHKGAELAVALPIWEGETQGLAPVFKDWGIE